MKRVSSLLLCLVLLITLLPVSKTRALENVSAETAAANIERLYSQAGGMFRGLCLLIIGIIGVPEPLQEDGLAAGLQIMPHGIFSRKARMT